MTIEYNKEYQIILTLNDWEINFYDKNLNFDKKVTLKYDFKSFLKVSYFRFYELEDVFYIVCKDYSKVYCYKFNIEGKLIYEKILSANLKKTILQLDYDNRINVIFNEENYSYEASCDLHSKNEEIFEINLHDEFDKQEKDWCGYEYVESIVTTNQENQFSLINVDATYGVQGVKIFQLRTSKELELIYDMDDLDFKGAFHNLAFNSKGKNFILLLYDTSENTTDYFSICEYSIENNKKPIKIHKTNFGFWNYGKIHTHFLNESVLGIVRNIDIIIFDLFRQKTNEIIKRDLNSDYFVSHNILIYQSNEKLVVREF